MIGWHGDIWRRIRERKYIRRGRDSLVEVEESNEEEEVEYGSGTGDRATVQTLINWLEFYAKYPPPPVTPAPRLSFVVFVRRDCCLLPRVYTPLCSTWPKYKSQYILDCTLSPLTKMYSTPSLFKLYSRLKSFQILLKQKLITFLKLKLSI